MLALVSLANYANFYVYDSIGPVAELLQRQRGFSDSQIGMLVLCALWYSTIFAFCSAFSIQYFQHLHGLDLAAAAGTLYSRSLRCRSIRGDS